MYYKCPQVLMVKFGHCSHAAYKWSFQGIKTGDGVTVFVSWVHSSCVSSHSLRTWLVANALLFVSLLSMPTYPSDWCCYEATLLYFPDSRCMRKQNKNKNSFFYKSRFRHCVIVTTEKTQPLLHEHSRMIRMHRCTHADTYALKQVSLTGL